MTDQNLDRRDFVRSVGMVAAMPAIVSAAPSILRAMPRREEEITVGLIGCGGRGTGAAVTALEAG
ncbi:MAG: hypothetical protein QMB94_04905, partial [Phycisphaerales bacterium]